MRRVLSTLSAVLSPLFWIFFLLGMSGRRAALLTLAAAAFHEAGHFLVLFAVGGGVRRFEGRLIGFRLTPRRHLGYRGKIAVAAAGPLCNLFAFAVLVPFPAAREFAVIHLFTALSNLLPLPGYDGEKILSALLALRFGARVGFCAMRWVRAVFSAVGILLSLYAAARAGEGVFSLGIFLSSLLLEVTADDGNVLRGFRRKREHS